MTRSAGKAGIRADIIVDDGAEPRARRRRRTTEEVIDSILAAASDEFELHGYAGATTAAIARRAGVAEPLIFSNFGSKARLFNASIFKPLNRHLMDFCANQLPVERGGGESREDLRRRYIMELEQFIDRHSRKFISILFAHLYQDKSEGLGGIEGLQDYFTLATSLETPRARSGQRIEPAVMARLSFAAIFSTILLRDLMFPAGMVTKEQLLGSLADFIIDGLNANG